MNSLVLNDYVPLEDDEESALCGYCDLLGYVHWHVPQETYTTSWKQKAKAKKLGVHSGVSDHWVKVPTPTGHQLFVIEMKRQKGNTPTDEQIKFIREMNEIENVKACCAYGSAEAISVLEEAKSGVYNTYQKLTERMEKIAENREKKAKNSKKPQKTVLPY